MSTFQVFTKAFNLNFPALSVPRGMPAGGGRPDKAKIQERKACLGSLLSVDLVVTQFGDQSSLFVDLCSQVGVLLPFVGCVVGRLQQLHHLRLFVFLRSQQQEHIRDCIVI